MIDKELMRLVKGSNKQIVKCTILNILALIANVCITAGICLAFSLTISNDPNINQGSYILPFNAILGGIVLRYLVSIQNGKNKALLATMVKKNLREQLFSKLLELEGEVDESIGNAALTQIAVEGIEQLDLYFTSYIPQFFFAMISPILLFAICATINISVATILLVCVPIIPIAIIITSKYAKKVFAKYWSKYLKIGDGFLDAMQGLQDLKLFMTDNKGAEKLAKDAEEFRKITMKVLLMQLASITIMDLVAFGGAAVGIARAVIAGTTGLNPIYVLFLTLLAAEFFLPLRALGSAFHVAMNGAGAGKKILAILKALPIQRGSDTFESGTIQLTNVIFAYDTNHIILNNINMTCRHRSITAIAGESGSGKTTLSRIILGQLAPMSGEVLINGKNISNIASENLYDSIACTSDSSYIFNDTILNNFKLAKPDITEEEIWTALKKVELDGFIKRDGGLEKIINDGASNISRGQKQRLALAINLTIKKKLYIFDEATSAVDFDSEKVIMKNIMALTRYASVILITHRLTNTKMADYIYYLKHGEIKESGTHKDLIAENGEYASIYNKQVELIGSDVINA